MAAGSGERLGADRPKAFVVVGGAPDARLELEALRGAGIEEIVVALPEDADAPAGCRGVRGGALRSASVRNALGAAGPDAEAVVVHDAARPLVTPAHFTQAVAALAGADAAIAGAP